MFQLKASFSYMSPMNKQFNPYQKATLREMVSGHLKGGAA